jgi:hypothetical protein
LAGALQSSASTLQIEEEVSKEMEGMTLTPEQKRKLAFRSILEHLLDLDQPMMDEALKKMLEKEGSDPILVSRVSLRMPRTERVCRWCS